MGICTSAERRGFAQKNYIRKREGPQQVPIDLRSQAVSYSPLGETDDFEDSDFYGICNDFENKASPGKLELLSELKFEESDLETYGEETQEWQEWQLHYENIKRNIERKISLRIGFVGLREDE